MSHIYERMINIKTIVLTIFFGLPLYFKETLCPIPHNNGVGRHCLQSYMFLMVFVASNKTGTQCSTSICVTASVSILDCELLPDYDRK